MTNDVELTGGGRAALILGVLSLVAVSGVAVVLREDAKVEAARLQEFRQSGRTVPAQVIDVRRRRGKNSSATVHFSYSAGGQTFTGQQRMRLRAADGLEPGARINVRYLPSQPGAAWMEGTEPRAKPAWLAAALPAGAAAGLAAVLLAIRRQKALLASGRRAFGRVTRVEDIRRKGVQHRVHYEWKDLSGATHTGHYDLNAKAPAPGTTVNIVYDADTPSRHLRSPASLVRLRAN